MKRIPAIAFAAAALATLGAAQTQYTARVAPTAKVPGVTSATTLGGFLGGADDCNSAHTNAGTGGVSGVPFSSGTTGTTGQAEANCYFFGTSGITNDEWYDWTANQNGTANLQTCGQTGVDTKVAIYPLSTCPADGTSLACNDDACGLQTGVAWNITSGTTYTIQVGTFPGASGGSGTFSIGQSGPPVCGTKDDGTTENALGLTAGGEIGWIKVMNCATTHDSILTAYGTAMFPGSVSNGNTGQLVVYTNPTGSMDVNDLNWVHSVKLATVVVNGDTDILNKTSYPAKTEPAGSSTMILASATQIGGQFPGPGDQNGPGTPNPNAWVVGDGAALNTTTLQANGLVPQTMDSLPFGPWTWLLRIENTGSPEPGTSICFGDGSGAPCGCGNTSNPAPPGSGCRNSRTPAATGEGAILATTGNATLGAGLNLTLEASGVRQTGVFLMAVNTLQGGSGITFGDGIRCCGGNLLRVSNESAGAGPATVTTTITTNSPTAGGSGTLMGGVTAGDKRCFQYWYRDNTTPNDPLPNPCGVSFFNLSNAVTVTFN